MMVSLVLLCSAAWFIISQSSNITGNSTYDDNDYYINSVPVDTSSYFKSSVTVYNGEKNEITISDEGALALFGVETAEAAKDMYSWVYKAGVLEEEYVDNTKNMPEGYEGIAAGTHYYEITDTTTGQIICYKHAVKIEKVKLTPKEHGYAGLVYVGKTSISYNAVWTGLNDEDEYSAVGTYAPTKDDYKDTANQTYSALYEISATKIEIDGENYEKALFENNYDLEGSEKVSVPYIIMSTCYSITGSTKAYYANLDHGLEKTYDNKVGTNTTTLVAMQSFSCTYDEPDAESETGYKSVTVDPVSGTHYNHSISGEQYIDSDVKLIIPYSKTSKFDGSEGPLTTDRYSGNNDATPSTNATSISPTCVNKVTMSEEAILNNNGTIEICGILGFANPSAQNGPMGCTSKQYAMLNMAKKSTVNTSGTMNIYGYITNNGVGTADTAKVNATAGKIYMPFVVYDHWGGGTAVGDYKSGGISPVSLFDMPNIQAKLKCNSGVSIVGYADLYTNKAALGSVTLVEAQHNLTTVNILGTTSSLIQLTSGYAEFEYIPTQGSNFGTTTANSIPKIAAETKITLCGTAETGDLELTVKVAFLTETVSLTDVMFPVSHKMELNLTGNYKYTLNSSFKFMPGSILNIEEGAELELVAGKELLIYEKFFSGSTPNDRFNNINKLRLFYDKTGATQDAQCNVWGTLTANGNFGGRITAKSAAAKVVLNGGTSADEVEGNGSAEASNAASGGAFDPVGNGEKQDADGIVMYDKALTENFVNATYTSVTNGSGFAWIFERTFIITYETNGGSVAVSSTNGKAYTNVGLTIPKNSSYLQIPTKQHYDFLGWYLDPSFKTAADDAKVFTDVKLYAKWTPTVYTVTFVYVYPDGSTSPSSTDTFTVETPQITLPETVDGEFSFNGWYFDSSGSNANKVDDSVGVSGAVLLSKNNGNIIYGNWVSDQYVFTFDNLWDVTMDPTLEFTAEEIEAGTDELPGMPDYSTDTTKYKYFSHWQYVDANNEVHVIDSYKTLISKMPQGEYTATLTAVWINKYALTVTGSSGGNTNIPFNETVYLLESQIATQFATYDAAAKVYDGTSSVNKYFVAWKNGESTYTSLSTENFTATDANGCKSLTLTATWGNKVKLVVTFESNNLGLKTQTIYLTNGTLTQEFNVTANDSVQTEARYFKGWTSATGCSASGKVITVNNGVTEASITASFGDKLTITITVENSKVTIGGTQYSSSGTARIKPGEQLTVSASANTMYSLSSFTIGGSSHSSGSQYTFEKDVTIKASSSFGCLVEGTLITLADGTQKKVEELTYDDIVLIFNHETGKMEPGYIAMLDHKDIPADLYTIMNLEFSNGELLRLVGNHGLFDVTLNKYIFVDESNMLDYIGHQFYYSYYNGTEFVSEIVTLTNAYTTEETVRVFSPVTVWHMNYFANGILNYVPAPYGITGHINYFELNDDMTYNEEKMQADIEKYGLYTYDDFAECLTIEQFNALPFKYFKVAVGKGMLTWEELMATIEYINGNSLLE